MLRYAVVSAVLVFVLFTWFVYYVTQARLVAQSEVVQTQLNSEISLTVEQSESLISLPSLWTGLMDSFSREAYLRPLITQLNRAENNKYVVLDYKGRSFLEPDAEQSGAVAQARRTIEAGNAGALTVQIYQDGDRDETLLLLAPIVSSLSEAPLGYLLTQFSLAASINKLNIDDALHIGFSLTPHFGEPPGWSELTISYEDKIKAGAATFSYYTRYEISILPNLQLMILILLGVAISGWLGFYRSKRWLASYAQKLTARLDQLVNYAEAIFSGNHMALEPEMLGGDQVSSVIRTLKSMLDAQYLSQAKLRKLAYEDSLTGLPNFARFYDVTTLYLSEQARDQRPVTLLFLDINKLKHINDTFGHHVGNAVIRSVAHHLEDVLPEPHMICRRSGDEFLLWVQMDEQDLIQTTAALGSFVLDVENVRIPVSLTCGAARYPQDAHSLNDLIFCAEYALIEAKSTARQTYVIFDEALGKRLVRNRQIEERIKDALMHHKIRPFYQPDVNMQTGEISGFEVLARWEDELLGWVAPDDFVPILERVQMSAEFSLCMLHSVQQELPVIRDRFPHARFGFNVSPKAFLDERVIQQIVEFASGGPIPFEGFEVELTEEELVGIDEDLKVMLERLISAGVHIAIDDFGKRYSSLSRLALLPLHRLKIDMSFVENIDDEKGREIIRLIVSLAKSLGLELTAEGVETLHQRDLLVGYGCHYGQGWLYGKAMSLADVCRLPEVLEPNERATSEPSS